MYPSRDPSKIIEIEVVWGGNQHVFNLLYLYASVVGNTFSRARFSKRLGNFFPERNEVLGGFVWDEG